MINFQYTRASDVSDAVRQIAADPTAKFIAGDTNLLEPDDPVLLNGLTAKDR